MSFFSLHFKKNFECQVGGVGQKIIFFVGVGGIKFEIWWGGSSFSVGIGGHKICFRLGTYNVPRGPALQAL